MPARPTRPTLPILAVVAISAVLLVAGCVAESTSDPSPSPAVTPTPSEAPIPSATPASPRTSNGSRPADTPAQRARRSAQLIRAAWANDLPRAGRLIRAGADVNAQDSTEQSAFLIAASEGRPRLLDLTLRRGADVDARDSFDGTALIRAAERGHAGVVARLLRAGTPIDHVNNLGWTALHEAVVLGDGSTRYLDTVRLLIAAGADLSIPAERDGLTAREHAESRGQREVAALLAAADRTDEARPNPRLLAAAEAGDADRVALALRGGATVDARDDQERTPLLLAVTGDHVRVATVLLAVGADPDALDDQHDTPWLVTGVTGSVPMAEVLLSAEPDLGILNRFGGTSLIPASERGHVAYVRRVLSSDIEVNHVNDLGWTALLEAVILGDGSAAYQEIVRLLLAGGADPRIADRDGLTALEHAERSGQRVVAGLLAE